MKKVALILLIGIYSLSSFGFSINGFYCCGSLKTISVSLSTETKDNCIKGGNSKGCCKTKSQVFKVKDNHLVTPEVSTPVYSCVDQIHCNNILYVNTLQSKKVAIINGSHAPPLYAGLPLYISHCVYRI